MKRYAIEQFEGVWYLADLETGLYTHKLFYAYVSIGHLMLETYEVVYWLHEFQHDAQIEAGGLCRVVYAIPGEDVEVYHA